MTRTSGALGLAALLALAGCGGKTAKPDAPRPTAPATAARASAAAAASGIPAACRQVRDHRDEDYTPGGLYAPGVRDSAPEHALDISGLVEPEPRDEPPSAYGNRTPYTVLGKSYRVLTSPDGYVERGTASWYGQKFHGRQTSSREIYDMCGFSAAHKTLPLPSYVRVTRLDTGDSVVVRVNDRGPFHPGRVIDLSYAAAIRLGLDRAGTAPVEVRALPGGARLGDAPAPVPPAAIAAAPRGPEPADDGSRRVVQVGAFREKDTARRLARRLEDAGLDEVDVDDASVRGGVLWRVRVGPLRAALVADVVARIRALGLPEPSVLANE